MRISLSLSDNHRQYPYSMEEIAWKKKYMEDRRSLQRSCTRHKHRGPCTTWAQYLRKEFDSGEANNFSSCTALRSVSTDTIFCCCQLSSFQAVIYQMFVVKNFARKLSGSRQSVIKQSSDSRQAVFRESSGLCQVVIRQLSGSCQAVIRHLYRNIYAIFKPSSVNKVAYL